MMVMVVQEEEEEEKEEVEERREEEEEYNHSSHTLLPARDVGPRRSATALEGGLVLGRCRPFPSVYCRTLYASLSLYMSRLPMSAVPMSYLYSLCLTP
jgi:hypothetical protein